MYDVQNVCNIRSMYRTYADYVKVLYEIVIRSSESFKHEKTQGSGTPVSTPI